ncbi:MAG: molybdopterin-dependent oxidoreductase [Dehalococcoidia bacterium]|nr:molybdopterin-dependent oxidoreductase [Dehalococcoidia bacterium]
MATEVKRVLCYFCHQRCGLLVEVEDGKATRVRGNPNHLFRGFSCVKGRASIEYHDHPDRLNYPLKRVGDRGENKWQRIPWEQALDEIASRLASIKREYGPEALVTAEGTHRTNIQWALRAFMHLYGTPNMISAGTICYCNTTTVHLATYGWYGATAGASTADASCVVQWGHNPHQCYPLEYETLRRVKKDKGTKIIVVDPRRTETAKLADIWLPIRPATDAAMALAWLNVIINEGLYDRDFVDKWTLGFDQLRDRVQEYTPRKVAEITRVPEEDIREAARLFATVKPAFLGHGLATDQIGRNSSQAIRAFCCLRTITGNLDTKGGERLGRTGDLKKFVWDGDLDCGDQMPVEQWQKQLGSDRFRLQSYPGWKLLSEPFQRVYGHGLATYPVSFASPMYVWDAILTAKPYPVKAFIAQGNNTLLCFANTRKVYQALKAVDLLVVMDYWLTPTALLADYALPAATWLERDDVCAVASGDMGNMLVASERAVPPLYERRTDYDFWRGMAFRLGLDKGFPWKDSLAEMWDYRLKPMGLTFKELLERNYYAPGGEYKKYEQIGFATPSGKAELYSSIFEKLGYDPLPSYEEPAESPERTPELVAEYPLILTTSPRHAEAYHSEHRQIRSLRRRHPDPQVEIHERTAERLDISHGDWVYVETRRGRIRMRAKVTSDIVEDVVTTEHSWWFPEEPEEEPFLEGVWVSNANLLTSDSLEDADPMCGGWTNRGLLCKVYRVKDFKS